VGGRVKRRHDREAIGARLRFEILRRCNFACYYCGVPASLGVKVLHVDHVIPVDLGGTNDPWNLVAACWDCNSGKTNGAPSEALIELVRRDYCAYVNATDVLEVKPCMRCGIPVAREHEDEELPDEVDCSRCNDTFFLGYDYGRGKRV
jgi:5-methylcytosine-specific restriction endonuclease McrA